MKTISDSVTMSRPPLPKPSEVGFTSEQVNYLNELVRIRVESHLRSMKQTIDKEIDKIVEQLTCEIDELRSSIETSRDSKQSNAVVSVHGSMRGPEHGQLVTADLVRQTITDVVKKSSGIIQLAATKAATEAALEQIMPRIEATHALAEMTAAYMKYKNDDTADELNAYRAAAMIERETDPVNVRNASARSAYNSRGRGGSIIPGAVRTAFGEDDVV